MLITHIVSKLRFLRIPQKLFYTVSETCYSKNNYYKIRVTSNKPLATNHES